MREAYVTSLGCFLPGPPVGNDEMEGLLGMIGGVPSTVRPRVLSQNGIRLRHYAMDREQRPTHRNSEMAAEAARAALQRGGHRLEDVEFIAAATTQGDLSVPGFASMVHGELRSPTCEIASLHGVCASGAMALKSAVQRVRTEPTRVALACASELPSRLFKASRYERQVAGGRALPFDTELLRWMLSDGAGAAVVQDEPHPTRLSLRVDWIEIRSHANEHEVCMYAGTNKGGDGKPGLSWLDYPTFEDAAAAGAINLKQDVRMLERVMQVGAQGFLDLVEKGRIVPGRVDWMVCHYSSAIFREQAMALARRAGVDLPPGRWFSNLATKGNVGCASLFVLLEDLVASGQLQEGQTIVAVVPESGRFLHAYLKFTVVGPRGAPPSERTDHQTPARAAVDPPRQAVDVLLPPHSRSALARRPRPVVWNGQAGAVGQPGAVANHPAGPPPLAETSDALQAGLVRRLTKVWLDFESKLHQVPIVARLEGGTLTVEDYRALLANMRQQVMEGSRWIARAASSMDVDHAALRSLILEHAKEEHRDYEMLERDYVGAGGRLDVIQATPKNIGSEALSAWMFHRASEPNPIDLLGAMFIIEGLGNRLARRWGEAVRDGLGLPDEAVTFLLYHGGADEGHLAKLEGILASGILTPALADRIVKTAKVTARLYVLQLEEVGNA